MAVLPSVEAELESLGVSESVEGQCALALAEQIDADRKNSMATAGDVARLLTVMAAIRDRKSAVKGDRLDDLRARREKRQSASEAV